MSKAKTLCKCEITPEVIGREVLLLLSSYSCWHNGGEKSAQSAAYDAGAVDLANALIDRYEGRAEG